MAGSDQIGSKKGGDSDAEGAAVPVSAVANGSLTPGTTDKDSSGAPPCSTQCCPSWFQRLFSTQCNLSDTIVS